MSLNVRLCTMAGGEGKVRNENLCFVKSTDMLTCLCINSEIRVTQEETVTPENTLVNLALP